jgi:hypothetical protein
VRLPDCAACVLGLALLLPPVLASGTSSQAAPPIANDDAEMARAREIVKADPLVAPRRTFKSLKWRDSGRPSRSSTPAWMAWTAGLFTWVGQSARYLVWAAAAVLAVLLILYVIAVARPHVTLGDKEPLVAPTHVRDLDIRPENLPGDVGAAARTLWDDGHQRAALALLYRGLLSRLAHVHDIPIADSTTEGDCLRLTALHLPPQRRDYASRLVRVWQRAVYGRETIDTASVHDLCNGFGAAMNAVPFGPPPRGTA